MNRPPFQVSVRPQARGRSRAFDEYSDHDEDTDQGQYRGYGGHRRPHQHRLQSDRRSHSALRGYGQYRGTDEQRGYGERKNRSGSTALSGRDGRSDQKGGGAARSTYELEKFEIIEPPSEEDWRGWAPGRQEWVVMGTLTLVSLIVALDETILVSALPVSIPLSGGKALPNRAKNANEHTKRLSPAP
jgi:hypothetical protein